MASYHSVPSAKRRRTSQATGAQKLAQACLTIFVPPLIFFVTSTALAFSWHYQHPKGTWFLVALAALPVLLSIRYINNSRAMGLDSGWGWLSAVLFVAAVLAGIVFGVFNFWYFTQPAYFLDTLRTYTDLSPTGVTGGRLMDAGKVHFSNGTRVATDLAMSFTSWDVFCVAPIVGKAGLLSEGDALATYDLWAVGVNCCRSGETNFQCDAVADPTARGGLRLADESQRSFYQLAVQQAEAAYDIRARQPIFFHWVKDPEEEQVLLYKAVFGNWVMANIGHFWINCFCLILYQWVFRRPSKDSLAVLEV